MHWLKPLAMDTASESRFAGVSALHHLVGPQRSHNEEAGCNSECYASKLTLLKGAPMQALGGNCLHA